ncbi:tRNA (guanine-N(7)-)-methyltransferase [Pseudovibrio axinellae]|uniref:tRNA (guanine-N(7)-)-methyltransferase n=1 Tax=Pseudovibrio axinellae TaxID=989403 RepID=A0A165Z8C2_9HYPH|nr:tRNA (guanosine(46)-N7)-methyltransferase TrmB [Pseudovibrio axinellae]KZL19596.1 tRNA (guanine-N(7)-)-methyltransferase [Pseudovibrio axinellae]SEQ33511.1 tRNA (guanine-N7-)-methyltransferase [Pseudovibrio axinellae]
MVDHYKGSFFGRRVGKPASPRQSQLLQDVLPALALDLTQTPPADLAELFPVPVKSVCLEIGFGGSEHLIHRAQENPEIGFIGCEPFSTGIIKAVTSIETLGLKNIRLYDDDAGKLLDWLPAASLDMAYQLYPDPWPKKKHWKRRFVNQINLTRIARALKPGCEYRFASDIDTYVDWTLSHCRQHPAFEWSAECPSDWRTPWQNWPGTRYERKAHRERRIGRYLTFLRVEETKT